MPAQRYNVSLEPELVARVDAVAGSRGRSAFLARAAEKALEGASRSVSDAVADEQAIRAIRGRKALHTLQGPVRERDAERVAWDLHEDTSAWRPGDPIPEPRVNGSPGERIAVARQARQDTPKRKTLGFDPSRFNQARSLR